MTTIYEVLRRPLVTEKSRRQFKALNQYAFEVAPDATKTLVKDAIETLFKVDVVDVRIITLPGKRTRRMPTRRLVIRKPGYKKAIVTLAEGQTIEFFEGVQ
jgi:large subunit ribosomal protein L23